LLESGCALEHDAERRRPMKRCAFVLVLLMLAILGSSGLALAGEETSASEQTPIAVSAEFLASLDAPTAGESCAAEPGKISEIGPPEALAAACTRVCTVARDCPRCPRECPAECLNGCCLCPCR
jgi:hypothetical protein